MENPEGSVFQISSTVRALSSALRGESRSAAGSEAPVVGVSSSSVRGGCPWFKESSAKNLRSRDFIAPSAVLNKLFPEGQCRSDVLLTWLSYRGRCLAVRLVKERGLLGFDPNLGSCLVQERCVAHLAELQGALSRCEAGLCTALHVVCCEDEFQLQQTDLLWRIAGLGGKIVQGTLPSSVCGDTTNIISYNLHHYLQSTPRFTTTTTTHNQLTSRTRIRTTVFRERQPSA
ncbi:UNVERIFIED_CONTAM: hypothetical protein FKN15_012842 [Acipenser sinensis]